MPLLNPNQIKSVLHEARVLRPREEKDADIKELLNDSNLSEQEVLENLSSLMRGAESDSTRLGAAKIALELHGRMKKDGTVLAPVFNLIIKDSHMEVNPIIFPRQMNES